MASFESIFNEIKSESNELIKVCLAEYINEAKNDVNEFFDSSKEKLMSYSQQFINGEIDKEELEWLIQSQKDLLQMKTLEQTGLAKVRVHMFKGKLINLITKAILGGI